MVNVLCAISKKHYVNQESRGRGATAAMGVTMMESALNRFGQRRFFRVYYQVWGG